MLNAFPIQAFKPFHSTLIADASDLIGFDKNVHEASENPEIVIKAPGGHIAKLTLTHTARDASGVTFWQFTNINNKAPSAVIFND